LDVSVESRGNALGIGLADLITERLLHQIDFNPIRINSLTANSLTRARVPLAMPTDRDVFAVALDTCWRIEWSEARLVLIPNTLELTTLWVTQPLAAEVEAHSSLTFETDFQPMPFDAEGNLDQELLFPESLRGRRVAGGTSLKHV